MLPTMTNGRLICLELKATSKESLFDEMAQMLARDGAVSDQQQFVKDVWAREQLDCTGFEQGVALPHAKSKAVSRPAIAIGVRCAATGWKRRRDVPSGWRSMMSLLVAFQRPPACGM